MRNLLISFLLLMVVTGLSACRGSSTGELDDANDTGNYQFHQPVSWNVPGGDETQRNYFSWRGPSSGDLNWETELTPYLRPLKETADGTLYAIGGGYLHALDGTGNRLWRYPLDSTTVSSFTIGADNLIRFVDTFDRIHTIDLDGSPVSVVQIQESISECQFDGTGRAYVGYYRNSLSEYTLIALDGEGNERWRTSYPIFFSTYSVYVVQDSQVYTVDSDFVITALDLDGNELWRLENPDETHRQVTVVDNGLYVLDWVFFGTTYLGYYDDQGVQQWRDEWEMEDTQRNFVQEYAGLDNNLYYFLNGDLLSVDTTGVNSEVATNVWDLVGISDTGVIHLKRATSTGARYSIVLPNTTIYDFPEYPPLYDYNQVIGYDTHLFGLTTDGALRGLNLVGTYTELWTIENLAYPIGLFVDSSGSISVLDRDYLTRYSAAGEQTDRVALPEEIVDLYDADSSYYSNDKPGYLGYWEETGSYLLAADYFIYCLSENGTVLWTHDCGSVVFLTGVLTPTGAYIAHGPRLTAITPGGEVVFSSRIEGATYLRDLAVGMDGTCYVADTQGKVYAVSRQGEVLWTYEAEEATMQYVTVAGKNQILVINHHYLAALDHSGNELWQRRAAHEYISSPAVGPSGLIYVVRNLVVEPEGDIAPDDSDSEVSSTRQGSEIITYASSDDSMDLIVLDSTGTLVDTIAGLGEVTYQPIVDNRGVAYVLNSDHELFAVQPGSGIVWKQDVDDFWSVRPSRLCWAPARNNGIIFAQDESIISVGP